MPVNPAIPKTIQSVGNSGDSGYDTGGTVVVVVTGFVRTGIGVTGRIVALVVDSDFICCVMVTVDISVGVCVGAPSPFRSHRKVRKSGSRCTIIVPSIVILLHPGREFTPCIVMVPHHNEICGCNSLFFQPSIIDREPDIPCFNCIFPDPVYSDIQIVSRGVPRDLCRKSGSGLFLLTP